MVWVSLVSKLDAFFANRFKNLFGYGADVIWIKDRSVILKSFVPYLSITVIFLYFFLFTSFGEDWKHLWFGLVAFFSVQCYLKTQKSILERYNRDRLSWFLSLYLYDLANQCKDLKSQLDEVRLNSDCKTIAYIPLTAYFLLNRTRDRIEDKLYDFYPSEVKEDIDGKLRIEMNLCRSALTTVNDVLVAVEDLLKVYTDIPVKMHEYSEDQMHLVYRSIVRCCNNLDEPIKDLTTCFLRLHSAQKRYMLIPHKFDNDSLVFK